MGAQIAAHFANAGVPSLLLDLTPEAATEGLKRARALKPDPFFTPDTWKLITTGGFEDGLSRVAEADWIIEAVVENFEAKRDLLPKVDRHRRPGSLVSSNTSGLPIASLAAGLSPDGSLSVAPLPKAPEDVRPYRVVAREFDRKVLRQALAAAEGNVPRAARLLRLPLSTFRYRAEKLGLVGRSTRDSS